MSRRWGETTRLWVYQYLVLRDGEFCQKCGKDLTALNNNETTLNNKETTQNTLDIDHIDGDKHNNEPGNLRLLCRRCNVIAQRQGGLRVANCVSVCERAEGKPATRIIKAAAKYQDGSPEMKANLFYEVTFREWLLEQINLDGGINKREAIASGAELVGCSPSTTKRYIEKLTSKAGCLDEKPDMLGNNILTLKARFQKGIYPLADLEPLNISKLIKEAGKVKTRLKR